MFVLATAGHVDHGKSTLLRLLTGMEPDRLPEEKRRSMTIDLNFVWLPTSRGTVGIVDVPGHKKFVKNMVAGSGNIDAFIFLVAADDGWMPQSEEHLQILRLMNVRHGILVITKTDLVDKSRVAEVVSDAKARLRELLGEDIETFTYSSETSEGLPLIKKGLESLVNRLSPSGSGKGSRFWVDRVFNPKGMGVVVTGTLREGDISVGSELFHWPKKVAAPVRNLECYHEKVTKAEPTTRLAIQIGQLSQNDISRGNLLTAEEPFLTQAFDARLTLIDKFPKRNTRLKCYLGTLEEPCLCILLEDGLVRLKFTRPIPARMGDRFLLRLSGQERTLGGGVVLDPLAQIRSHKRAVEALRDFRPTLERAVLLEEQLRGFVDVGAFCRRSVFTLPETKELLTKTKANDFIELPPGVFLLRKNRDTLLELLQKTIKESKAAIPAKSLERVFAKEGRPIPLLNILLKEGIRLKLWQLTPKGYAVQENVLPLSAAAKKLLMQLKAAKAPIGLAQLGVAAKDPIYELIQQEKIVALPEKQYMDAELYQVYVKRVKFFLTKNEKATTNELKPLLDNPSRKITVSILEKMDADRVTYLKDGVRRLLVR